MNDVLLHSDSKEEDKRGADVSLTLDANLQKEAYDLISDFTGSAVVLKDRKSVV